MRYRLVPILIGAVILAAVIAAVTANPVSGFPSKARACTDCHPAAPASATVSATPSTSTPAPGASYNVTVNLAGLTSSGDTGYWISNGAGTPTVSVYAGDTGSNQTTYTRAMTAPSTPGTYSYTVWCERGSQGSGQAKSTTYSITVPAPVPVPTAASLTPNHAQTGASVVIAGSNLGSGGSVRFGSTVAATSAWSASSVTVTVPSGLAAGATSVTVTPTGAAASNALAFTVDAAPAPVPAPVLNAITPASGLAGSVVTLSGANLGAGGTVTIGGVTAATSAWSTTAITATVPAGLTAGAKNVTVTSGGKTTNAVSFTVTSPIPIPVPTAAITSLTPNHAQTGASVVIAGSNLGSGGSVRFGSTVAATSAWSASSVTVTVPSGLAAGATSVTVTPTGAAASNALAFTVDAAPAPVPAPVLNAITPASGLAGSVVTLSGANLGAGGTVTIGGVTAATSAWSTTAITATVPAGLTAGAKNVTVTSGGKTTNAVSFTVTSPIPIPVPTAAITSLTPNHAQTGASVVIAGSNLGSGGSVRFGSTVAATSAWSASSVTVTVPSGLAAGATSVTVTPTGAAASNALAFTVDAAPAGADTTRPTTKALSASRVRRYRTATLRYQVNDPAPNAGWARVVIRIKDRKGQVVKVLDLGKRTVNTPLRAAFRCTLRTGVYRFYVRATDAAGNRQTNIAWQTLTVIRGEAGSR